MKRWEDIRTKNSVNTLEEGKYPTMGEIRQGNKDSRGDNRTQVPQQHTGWILIAWNVRGLNKVYKHKELMVFLEENKVRVIAITESRVKENNELKL